jgi:MucB/RseB N-terminal domain
MLVADRWASQVAAQLLLVTGSVLLTFGQHSTAAETPSANVIVERMMTAKSRQTQQLQSFDVIRAYRVDYQGLGGARHAEMQVASTYVSPNRKAFRIISQSGSRFLLDRIINKLLESEKEYQLDEADSDLSPHNYEFKLLGTEQVAGNDSYVMEITPRRKAKYLCRGKIWVDTRDFAIVRLEGEPAKNPSFWVTHASMANTYQKIGDFWLPAHKDATSDVRLGGKAVLAIDFSGYRVIANPKGSLEASRLLLGMPRPAPSPVDQR